MIHGQTVSFMFGPQVGPHGRRKERTLKETDEERRRLMIALSAFPSSTQPWAPLKVASCKAFGFVLESASDGWKLSVQVFFRMAAGGWGWGGWW